LTTGGARPTVISPTTAARPVLRAMIEVPEASRILLYQ
jgi:hypothetical protein